MSPEQAAGSRDLDGRSDLYSLGCVLYEMLAGRAPFVGPTVESIVHQHLASEPPSIANLRPAVPAGVVAALSRALSKTPADRFNPVALFGEAILPRPSAAIQSSVPVPARGVVWRRWGLIGVGVAVVVVGGVALTRWSGRGAAESRYPRTAIAVLPFQNLSAEGPHAYFAGGLHDELLTQLSKVAALSVRGRTSVMGYAGTTKPTAQIADELAVGTIVEASVQVVGERLRVNVQLIDAARNEHLWAESYDRTLDDAFAIQSDIAQQVVAAVGARVGATERTALAAPPTANAQAYRLYLQGLAYYRRPSRDRRNWEVAQELYERALGLEPGFALAHAALSELHGAMYWWRYDLSPQRAARQREEAEAALRLAPDLPEAHVAMGLAHYWGRRDYQRALQEFAVARRQLPSVVENVGAVHRRLGNWDEAVAAWEEATRLDPRDAAQFRELGNTYAVLRRYSEALREFDRALGVAPDLWSAAVDKGFVYVVWRGELDTLEAVLLRSNDVLAGSSRDSLILRVDLLFWKRQGDSMVTALSSAGIPVLEGPSFSWPTALYVAFAHQLRGDDSAARAAFEVARAFVDSVLRERPDDFRIHQARGLALASLGRREAALQEARWLERSALYREDAYAWDLPAEHRALILMRVGEGTLALHEIEQLLARPSRLSVELLRLDPRYDPIRADPRFQALLVKYANPQQVR
jgi:TolB-like protein/Flp pilus assembly protein TadD